MQFALHHRFGAALIGAALIGTGLSVAPLATGPAMAQTVLNLSDVLPESNFMVANAMRFAEEV